MQTMQTAEYAADFSWVTLLKKNFVALFTNLTFGNITRILDLI